MNHVFINDPPPHKPHGVLSVTEHSLAITDLTFLWITFLSWVRWLGDFRWLSTDSFQWTFTGGTRWHTDPRERRLVPEYSRVLQKLPRRGSILVRYFIINDKRKTSWVNSEFSSVSYSIAGVLMSELHVVGDQLASGGQTSSENETSREHCTHCLSIRMGILFWNLEFFLWQITWNIYWIWEHLWRYFRVQCGTEDCHIISLFVHLKSSSRCWMVCEMKSCWDSNR